MPITESVVIYSFVLLGWYCVVPENIHTSPQTEFHLGPPSTHKVVSVSLPWASLRWLKACKLSLNVAKTVFMVITGRGRNYSPQLATQ